MKNFLTMWMGKEPKEATVYWKKIEGKYMSAIKQGDGFNKIDSKDNMVDLKANTTKLLKSISNGDIKLVWKRA